MACRILSVATLLQLLWSGCGGSNSGLAPDTYSDVLQADAVAADARSDSDSGRRPDFATDNTAPRILELKLEENGQSVLSALLSFKTDEPASWVLRVVDEGDGSGWRVEPQLEPGLSHRIPVLGLRALRHYSLVVEATDNAGNTGVSEPLSLDTPELPADLPPMRFLGSQPELMEPGYTLFNVLKWSDIQGSGLLVAVDAKGEVVWYYRATQPLVEALKTRQGTILAIIGEYHGVVEIDMLGNLLEWWKPSDLGVDSLHHAVGLTTEGNLLGLSTELRTIEGYPTQSGGTTSYSVVGEIAVEFTRSGQVVHSWPMLDVMDPYHFSPGFFVPFWAPLYPKAIGGPKDWGHGNGIRELPGGGSYLVSLANQDMVVNLERTTGKPIWMAGETGTVVLEEGGEWFSNPHGAELSDEGRLVVYDDGTYKTTEVPRSRLVEYQITPPQAQGASWKAKQVWSWDGGSVPFYSMSPADVDYLPGGNLLVVHGSLVGKPEKSPYSSENTLSVRIEELERKPEASAVFAMEIGGPWDATGQRLSSFAAVRIGSLYPEDWEVVKTVQDCDATCAESECGWKGGCTCGVCSLGKACLSSKCLSCETACLGRECGPIELVCDCGSCLPGDMCNSGGICQDTSEFCKPYCEGKECGIVGAFYLGQTCNCGECLEGNYCDYQAFACATE